MSTSMLKCSAWLRVAAAALALACSVPARGGVLDVPGSWLDDDGASVSLTQWHGRYTIVTMLVGGCTKVCSTTLRRLDELQAIADRQRLAVDFLVISLDPKSDTPQAWREYRAAHRLARGNWHFLGGSEAATRSVARLLGVSYWYYDEHVLHDYNIALLGPDGALRRSLTWTDDDPAQLFAGMSGPLARPRTDRTR
jgi:cytochrome oxidase Cu insertion factor (SCO1/SenC/PrrC family)